MKASGELVACLEDSFFRVDVGAFFISKWVFFSFFFFHFGEAVACLGLCGSASLLLWLLMAAVR